MAILISIDKQIVSLEFHDELTIINPEMYDSYLLLIKFIKLNVSITTGKVIIALQ